MSEKAAVKEKRKSERFPANFSLDIADTMKPGKKIAATVTDISEGGLGIEMSQRMDVDSTISLRMESSLMVQGGVTRMERKRGKYRYGVRFQNVRFQPVKREFSKPRTMVRMPRLP